ncbi:MAG: hypothetical protein D6805_00585 [Planctomycetota bacterium]|nr:MAG: hypothetical protein D6805_00585 [Planctomycetota bacterium]
MDRESVLNLYFLEHRSKLLDIAAFLDRVDRAQPNEKEDERLKIFYQALEILRTKKEGRAKAILNLFSDPTQNPIPTAPSKGACGVYLPPQKED